MATLTVEIPSFDELIERLGDKEKMAASKAKSLKIKTENRLSSQVKDAQVALIEAQERFEAKVLTDGVDLLPLVNDIQKAQTTLNIYNELYSKFFPNV